MIRRKNLDGDEEMGYGETKVVEQRHAQLVQLINLNGDVYTGSQAKRRVFIAAALEAVCLLLEDVTILVDEEVVGKNVLVHGRFEFVLKREKKKIPIVQAKCHRIPEGIAENVAGLEALCDIEGRGRALGIVTSYITWVFISDDDENIRWMDRSLQSSMPSKESLKEVLGMILGMLDT
jgi:hypothetical protein